MGLKILTYSGETPQRSTIPKPDVLKNVTLPKELIPNPENLDKLKRWGLKHYRVNRQKIQELMGTATITADPELDPRVEKLHDHITRYKELHQVFSSRKKSLTPTKNSLKMAERSEAKNAKRSFASKFLKIKFLTRRKASLRSAIISEIKEDD